MQKLPQEVIPLHHEQTAEQVQDEALTVLHLLQHVSLELRSQSKPRFSCRQLIVELSLQLVFQVLLGRRLFARLRFEYGQLSQTPQSRRPFRLQLLLGPLFELVQFLNDEVTGLHQVAVHIVEHGVLLGHEALCEVVALSLVRVR